MSGEIFGEYIYRIECGDMDDSGVIPIHVETTTTNIVRCRDCVYMTNQKYKSYEYQTCSYFDSEYAEVEPDGFCKWGERRA